MTNANEQTMIRYYFWELTKSYGWRQMGSCAGYETMKELSEDCEFYMVGEHASMDWKVLKAEVVLTKKQYNQA